ncbi:uncharacterized protein LOC129786381 [Lutzomyia longipalpis]|uniref:uncharacterized protein LOC129786381 n=1 Tax=Lutzomyia longipalpis TaxID=7200 RepID=UPI0024836930|nr:uncharacterized protein LOC129786381 [Lutzomyia longipalpis]
MAPNHRWNQRENSVRFRSSSETDASRMRAGISAAMKTVRISGSILCQVSANETEFSDSERLPGCQEGPQSAPYSVTLYVRGPPGGRCVAEDPPDQHLAVELSIGSALPAHGTMEESPKSLSALHLKDSAKSPEWNGSAMEKPPVELLLHSTTSCPEGSHESASICSPSSASGDARRVTVWLFPKLWKRSGKRHPPRAIIPVWKIVMERRETQNSPASSHLRVEATMKSERRRR